MIKIREGEGGKVNKEVKERVISILSAEIHNRNCKPRRFFCRAPPADRMVKIMENYGSDAFERGSRWNWTCYPSVEESRGRPLEDDLALGASKATQNGTFIVAECNEF